jgi:hypothetical protein
MSGFDADGAVLGAVSDVVDIWTGLFEKRPQLQYVIVQFTEKFKDPNGTVMEQPALTFTITNEQYRKTNWSNLQLREVGRTLAGLGEDAILFSATALAVSSSRSLPCMENSRPFHFASRRQQIEKLLSGSSISGNAPDACGSSSS